MQGLITLDFGNSNPHAGLFNKIENQWKLIKVVPWSEVSIFLNQLSMTPDNSQIVLAEVKPREEELVPLLQQGFLLTRVKEYWRGVKFAGMPVSYANTLGEDRLIQAHYTYKKDKTPTLLIDAGTYVTMDIINESGFQGGFILPGANAYWSSFSSGEQLKNYEFDSHFQINLPQTTADAMKNGYYAFSLLAKDLCLKNNIKDIILTGGAAETWQKLLSNQQLSFKTQEHYIHWSLLHWMTTQIEPL
jgi:type III pantothenate kinase